MCKIDENSAKDFGVFLDKGIICYLKCSHLKNENFNPIFICHNLNRSKQNCMLLPTLYFYLWKLMIGAKHREVFIIIMILMVAVSNDIISLHQSLNENGQHCPVTRGEYNYSFFSMLLSTAHRLRLILMDPGPGPQVDTEHWIWYRYGYITLSNTK